MANPLTSDPIALRAMLAAERAENERLRQIIKELQRHRFGRRAESLPIDQLLLGLEEAEQIEAEGLAGEEAADLAKRAERARKRRVNRGSLPAHLPRVEQVVDVHDKACPCCRGQRPAQHVGDERGELFVMAAPVWKKLAHLGKRHSDLQPLEWSRLFAGGRVSLMMVEV